MARLKTGAKTDGLADIQRAFELEPGNASGYVHLGIYHQDAGEYELAIAMYRKAKAVDAQEDVDALIAECEMVMAMQTVD